MQEAYSKITDDLELYDNIQNFSQVQDKERTEERKVTPHAKR